MTLVDTSALMALVSQADEHHAPAARYFAQASETNAPLVTTNYVVVEAVSVVQRRIGVAAVQTLLDDLLAVIPVVWVTPEQHSAAVTALRAASRRQLSLVGCVSFEMMRRLGVEAAFAFDPHFAEMGFDVFPRPAASA